METTRRIDRVVSYDPMRIKEEMRIFIDDWLQSTQSTLFLPTDGLSGSGKTIFIDTARNLVEQIRGEVSFVMIPVDLFLATNRGSQERILMTKMGEVHFWQTLYRRDLLIKVILAAAALGEEAGTITIPQCYNREKGRVESGNFGIEMPPGKKLVGIEGIDSIRVLTQANPNGNSETLGILKHARPEEAIERVINRGVARGSGSEKQLRQQYEEEYQFQIPRINNSNADNAHLILHDR